MGSCAAGNVEQCPSGRASLSDDLIEFRGLCGVILDSGPGVKQVVDPCALVVHGSEHSGERLGAVQWCRHDIRVSPHDSSRLTLRSSSTPLTSAAPSSN